MSSLLRLLIVSSSLTAFIMFSGFHQPLEKWIKAKSFEFWVHTVSSHLTIVEIDAKSIGDIGVWPWSRDVHAAAIENLAKAKPRKLFIDIDFSSKSASSEADRKLSDSLNHFAQQSELLLPAFLQPVSIGQTKWVAKKAEHLEVNPVRYVSVNLIPDHNGVVTSAPSGFDYDEAFFPIAGGVLSESSITGTLIDFSISPGSFTYVSFVDLLNDRVPYELLQDRMVLIGATAIELGDNITVPVYSSLPGVLVQALIAETFKKGALLEVSKKNELLLVAAILIISSMFFLRLTWQRGLISVVLLIGAWILFSSFSTQVLRIILPVALPSMVLIVCYVVSILFSLNKNIFEKIDLQFRLGSKESLLRNLFKTSNEAIVCLDKEGFIKEISKTGKELTGFCVEGNKELHINELLPSVILSKSEDYDKPVDTILMSRNGDFIPVEICLTKINFECALSHTLIVRDIRQRIQRERELEYQATYDGLTDLPNRSSLLKKLIEKSETNEITQIATLDLTLFKQINDLHGHVIGDLLLKESASRLKVSMASNGHWFHLGGDQFVCMFTTETSEKELIHIAEKLIQLIAQPYDFSQQANDVVLEISACIGISEFTESMRCPTTLLRRADLALQRAKQSLSQIAIYSEEMDAVLNRQIALAPKLQRAIRDDVLFLVFQPKISLSDFSVHGVEVLTRWIDNGEYIRPDWFIETAENTRLIAYMTEWMVDKLIETTRYWPKNNLPKNIAFNLSAQLLDSPSLIEEICKKLVVEQDYCEFEFEITESSLMLNQERALYSLEIIRGYQFNITVDDYGTGYSTLEYLNTLNPTKLKIDKSLVQHCDSDNKNRIIVGSTIHMAKELGLKVVAEGIETKEEEDFLLGLNCEYAQGYRYAKPMKFDDLIKWNDQWNDALDVCNIR